MASHVVPQIAHMTAYAPVTLARSLTASLTAFARVWFHGPILKVESAWR